MIVVIWSSEGNAYRVEEDECRTWRIRVHWRNVGGNCYLATGHTSQGDGHCESLRGRFWLNGLTHLPLLWEEGTEDKQIKAIIYAKPLM